MGFGINVPTTGTSGQVSGDTHGNTLVTLPQTESQAGYAVMLGESGAPGDPTAAIRRAIYASEMRRMRAGLDQYLFYEHFGSNVSPAAGAVNQNTLRQITTTQTFGSSGGYLIFNNGSSTAQSTGCLLQSYRKFSLPMRGPLEVGFRVKTVQGTETNKNFEIGWFQATTGTAIGLLDGVALRWTSSGTLVGVYSTNGSERTVSITTVPADNVAVEVRIVISTALIEFWINDQLQATLAVNSGDNSASGLQNQQPLSMRCQNTASPTSVAAQIQIANCWVFQNDEAGNRPSSHRAVGMGGHASLVQTGQAIGQNPSITNNTDPSSAAPVNTAARATGLGGEFEFNATASGSTDYIGTDFLVPEITATTAAKNLWVTGIRITAINRGATNSTTVPTTLQWEAAWGHTNVSLATNDGVNAHAPRRMILGGMSLPASTATQGLVGSMFDRDVNVVFNTPICVNPGEHFAIIFKIVSGAATASQTIRVAVGVEGYWE